MPSTTLGIDAGQFTSFHVVSRSGFRCFRRSIGFMGWVRFPAAPREGMLIIAPLLPPASPTSTADQHGVRDARPVFWNCAAREGFDSALSAAKRRAKTARSDRKWSNFDVFVVINSVAPQHAWNLTSYAFERTSISMKAKYPADKTSLSAISNLAGSTRGHASQLTYRGAGD